MTVLLLCWEKPGALLVSHWAHICPHHRPDPSCTDTWSRTKTQSTPAATEVALDVPPPSPDYGRVPRPKEGPAHNRGCHPGAPSSSHAAGGHSAHGGSPHASTCPASHRLHHRSHQRLRAPDTQGSRGGLTLPSLSGVGSEEGFL